jgi:hypothetical protein
MGSQKSAARAKLYGAADGGGDFAAAIGHAPQEYRETLRKLWSWADALEHNKLTRLYTFHGKHDLLTLLPYMLVDNAGLVSIYNDHGAYVQFWRSVFMRHAPHSLADVERVIAPTSVGRGNWTSKVSDEMLEALTAAYREAASRQTSQ